MSSHAKLSPSSAERWINCPPSVKMSERFKDKSSVYAEEGTLAHKLAELKLKKELMKIDVDDNEFLKIKEHELYSPDMEEHTDEYVEYIRHLLSKLLDKSPFIKAETKLDLSFIASNTFGTADCIIASGDELFVIDFKYGKNVEVSSEYNYQMMLYALGALELFDGLIYDFKKVTMIIIQPRMNNISTFTLSKKELYEFLNELVKPNAKKALKGEGNTNYGDWCKFCKAKSICRNYANKYNPRFKKVDPNCLTNTEIAERIKALKGLEGYLSELKDYAVNASLDGEYFPGYKVVEGRSLRAWNNEEEALEKIKNNTDLEDKDLFETKPKSISKLEKLIGKRKFADITDGLINKPKGKPTLVEESDKRPIYQRDDEIEEDLKEFLN